MREILFRGKTINTGKWIEGSLDQSQQIGDGIYLIRSHDLDCDYNSKKVIPETIGQHTGLADKNGVKIFEGDIIKFGENTVVIEYEEKSFQYIFWCESHEQWYGLTFLTGYQKFEVIGNIHDNPELLEVTP